MGVFSTEHYDRPGTSWGHMSETRVCSHTQVILTAPSKEAWMLLLSSCTRNGSFNSMMKHFNIVGMVMWGKGRDALLKSIWNSTSLHLRSIPCRLLISISSWLCYLFLKACHSWRFYRLARLSLIFHFCVQQLLPRMLSLASLYSHILWAGVVCAKSFHSSIPFSSKLYDYEETCLTSLGLNDSWKMGTMCV